MSERLVDRSLSSLSFRKNRSRHSVVLKEHGTPLAERFLLHEVIETCTAAEQYESAYARLGYDPPEPANLAYACAKRDRLCQRFGKAYKNNYGWAADVIGKE